MTTVRSREEAALLGLKRFYTGIPCRRGHLSERWVSTTGCLSCRKPPPGPQSPASAYSNRIAFHDVRIRISRELPPEAVMAAMVRVQGWVDHLSREAGVPPPCDIEASIKG